MVTGNEGKGISSEEYFSSLIENSSDIILVLSADATVRYQSLSVERGMGYKPDEFTGKNIFDFIHHEDLSQASKFFDQIKNKQGTVLLPELRFRHKDGTWRVVEGTAVNLLLNSAVSGIVLNCRDITPRKRMEAALQESEAKYRELVENANAIILRIDNTGMLTFINEFAQRFFGYTEDEVLGKNVMEIFVAQTESAGNNFGAMLRDMLGDPKNYFSTENENIRKNGEKVWVSWTNKKLYNKNGFLVEILLVGTDITERKRKEQELKNAYDQLKRAQTMLFQSSKMAAVGQLASGVAHEINNPLTGVLNNVQLIKMEMDAKHEFNAQEFRELLNVVEESALRCKTIVRSLLDFSHASPGLFQTLSLNEITEKVTALIENEMRLQKVTIQKLLEPGLPRILGDSQLLQQVLFNLISNAKWAIQKKSANDGGVITIETRSSLSDNRVAVSISDTGIGISKKNLERIFEPFFTTKSIGEGTGLGLSVAYNIIRQHNGSVKMESVEGEGTTITITFPVLQGK